MHTGQYVFAQITLFLPQRQFRRIVSKYRDRTEGWGFSHWSHLLVLMFGQLIGCGSLRELTDITTAHAKHSFKWIKQHLRVKRFWGDSENTVRIQIHVAIITYCLIAIIERDLQLGRPVAQVLRILGSSLLVKDDLPELFGRGTDDGTDDGQLEIEF